MRTKQDRHRTRLLEEHRRHFDRVTRLLGLEPTYLAGDFLARAELCLNNRESISICLDQDGLDLWLNVSLERPFPLVNPLVVYRIPERPLSRPYSPDSIDFDGLIPVREFLTRARAAWERNVPAEVRRSLRLAAAMAVILTPKP